MRNARAALALAAGLLAAALHAAPPVPAAEAATAGSLGVVRAWSRATAGGASVGVVYFEVVNTGPADTLQRIESPAAERAEVHATLRADGVMQMRPVPTVDIPAGGRVSFQPGGLHAMLLGLKEPLREGGRLPVTVVFRNAGELRFDAVIRGLGAADPPPASMTTPAAPPPPAASPAPAGLPPPAASPTPATGVPPASGFRLAVWPRQAESPELHLRDFDGRPRRLADYRGRVLVLFFGFVRCPDACPAQLFKLAAAMKRLGSVSRNIQVLFVTLDPKRDTPRLLKSYVTAFDPRFIGLTGRSAEIDRAARSFYVEYAKVGQGADYSIDHSTSTFVLDAHGRLRLAGRLDATVDDWVHDLSLIAAE